MRPEVHPGAARAFFDPFMWMDQIVIDASRTTAALGDGACASHQ
jgi:hypothetical protein